MSFHVDILEECWHLFANISGLVNRKREQCQKFIHQVFVDFIMSMNHHISAEWLVSMDFCVNESELKECMLHMRV